MEIKVITIDKNSSESDLKSCADLLLEQMSFINSTSTTDKVNNGLKLALDNPEMTKIFAAKKTDSEIIGIAFANKGTSITKSGYYLWINELHIKLTSREKGVATHLLNHIFDWCIEEKYKGISLVSSIDNEIAKHLYYKFGFESSQVLIYDKIF